MIQSSFIEADKSMSAFSMPTFEIEKKLLKSGFDCIAGIDEAGRGALAGPLSVGLVVYSSAESNELELKLHDIVNDSKKLNAGKRLQALTCIKETCLYSDHEMVSHEIVDDLNVNGATFYAIAQLVTRLKQSSRLENCALLMDGNFSIETELPLFSLKKGDNYSLSIASASIIAKVLRDQNLTDLDVTYPVYNFSENKGYGTKQHMQSIDEHGYCDIHRKSYQPIKGMLEKLQTANKN